MNNIDNLQNICRTCLSETNNLQSLHQDALVVQFLRKITDIDYSTINNGVPQQICKNCISKIQELQNFATKCINSDTILKNNYSNKPKPIIPPSTQITEHVKQEQEEYNLLTEELTVQGNNINIKINEFFEGNNKPTFQKKIKKQLHVCDVCEKSFKKTSHLKRHQLIHNGQRDYKCDICSKNFGVISSLQRHKKTHSNEKLFDCDICLKSFNDSSNLRQHKLIHNNERNFKCDICSKTFNSSSTLRQHKFSHEKEGPFNCEICLETFTRWSSLLRHRRRKHL